MILKVAQALAGHWLKSDQRVYATRSKRLWHTRKFITQP